MFAAIHCKMKMKHTNACSYMTRMKHTKPHHIAVFETIVKDLSAGLEPPKVTSPSYEEPDAETDPYGG